MKSQYKMPRQVTSKDFVRLTEARELSPAEPLILEVLLSDDESTC